MREQSQHLERGSSSNSAGPFNSGVFFDLNEQMERVFRDSSAKEESGRKTKMLVKYPEFRIALVTMRAGTRWNDHKTPARIFVQVLRGRIHFHTPGGTFELVTAHLITLDPEIVHSVDALEDSGFLLTLSDVVRQ
jgi:quercetin dioxygenase-like cupin family protein